MSIFPEGENVRNAIKWISAQRQDQTGTPLYKLIELASITYNLTPLEADSLQRILTETKTQEE